MKAEAGSFMKPSFLYSGRRHLALENPALRQGAASTST